ARALYRQKNILFLDEPTSALDNETSFKLIKNLFGNPNITIIMIAHRLDTLNFCNRVISLDNGKLIDLHTNN
ncbi:MAG: ABC transporter ATP-binding protein, partial [Alphaproteobacteria bacterium]